jgi:hypothetical protein
MRIAANEAIVPRGTKCGIQLQRGTWSKKNSRTLQGSYVFSVSQVSNLLWSLAVDF